MLGTPKVRTCLRFLHTWKDCRPPPRNNLVCVGRTRDWPDAQAVVYALRRKRTRAPYAYTILVERWREKARTIWTADKWSCGSTHAEGWTPCVCACVRRAYVCVRYLCIILPVYFSPPHERRNNARIQEIALVIYLYIKETPRNSVVVLRRSSLFLLYIDI